MNSDKFKKQIESMWKHRDTDEQKRLVKFTIAKTMRLTLEYPELAQEYFDSLCKVIPDNERITISNYQHNLTSDAEGEEMLTVSRKRVQEIYSYNEEILSQDPTHRGAILLKKKLSGLFGSKCLPDELTEDNFAKLHGDNLSPEPQPSDRTLPSYTSQPVTNCPQIDRLHIAAMAMQGLLSNADRLRKNVIIGSRVSFESFVARDALRYADALIAESHK